MKALCAVILLFSASFAHAENDIVCKQSRGSIVVNIDQKQNKATIQEVDLNGKVIDSNECSEFYANDRATTLQDQDIQQVLAMNSISPDKVGSSLVANCGIIMLRINDLAGKAIRTFYLASASGFIGCD